MHQKTTASLLFLLAATAAASAAAANQPVPAEFPRGLKPVAVGSTKSSDTKLDTAASAVPKTPDLATVNQKPGTVDAPVDGMDGKPHDGPGLFETGGKGTGDVGISGGQPHVDLKKPPPHTGDHEIADVEGLIKAEEQKEKEKEKGDKKEKPPSSDSHIDDGKKKTDDSKEPPSINSGSSGPAPADHHHEYIPSSSNTQKDPPVNPPSHLTPISTGSQGDGSSISQPLHSFVLSFVMIIFSEIGDKTFLIAALMAMKHPRLQVFTAALSSLIVMSILSAILGHAVPTLIPKKFTAFLAAGLFLVFGARMIKEGLEMEKGTANVQAEMSEVEAELQEKSRDRASSISRKLESGTLSAPHHGGLRRNTSSPSLSDSDEDDYAQARGKGTKGKMGLVEGVQNLAGLLLSPAWVQTFVMTFLGEWGDRSQIATIAMAAGQDYWYVTIGAISGHAICTGIAVIGGRMLASRISVRNVTLGGAGAFIVFGILYLGEALYAPTL